MTWLLVPPGKGLSAFRRGNEPHAIGMPKIISGQKFTYFIRPFCHREWVISTNGLGNQHSSNVGPAPIATPVSTKDS